MTVIESFKPPKYAPQDIFYQYKYLIEDAVFHSVLLNTLFFVVGTVLGHFLLALPVALALNLEFRARNWFRILMILPWTIPDVITGVIWSFIYNPANGFLNAVLIRWGLIKQPIPWLASPKLALFSVIMADIWRGYPYVMLVLLAGLQNIARELYEAAEVDGATTWERFFYVTLPQLKKVAMIALTLDFIWQFRRFGLIMSMTAGGPGRATEVLSTWVYKMYFTFFKPNYASAMAIVTALILLLFAIPYIREVSRE